VEGGREGRASDAVSRLGPVTERVTTNCGSTACVKRSTLPAVTFPIGGAEASCGRAQCGQCELFDSGWRSRWPSWDGFDACRLQQA
jgi:hypothetical protein